VIDMPTADAHDDGLLAMIASPTIWAIHFLLCYLAAAIFCAKAPGPLADLEDVRLWIGCLTLLALGGITYSGARAVRRGGFGYDETTPHDAGTVADRRRFVAFATLLLSGLSFVATAFVALPALFLETCR
jgi:hypothetical protein